MLLSYEKHFIRVDKEVIAIQMILHFNSQMPQHSSWSHQDLPILAICNWSMVASLDLEKQQCFVKMIEKASNLKTLLEDPTKVWFAN